MTADPRVPMRCVFGEHLVRLGGERKDLVVLDADTSSSTQTKIFAEAFPQRFINCGVAECNMVSVAAGIAATGLRPVVSTFAFLLANRAADQIRSQIAYSRLPVVLAGGYAGLSDFADGGSHQSVSDVSVFRAMPNMTVVCPGDARETELALEAALEQNGPLYLRLSRAEVGRLDFPGEMRLGRAIVRREGADVGLLSTGQILESVIEAGDILREQGVSAHIVDVHTVKPLDEDTVLETARRCGCLVTCEEHTVMGGLGSAVAETLSQNCPTPVRLVGIGDCFGQSGGYRDLREHYGLDAKAIAAAALDVMKLKAEQAKTLYASQ